MDYALFTSESEIVPDQFTMEKKRTCYHVYAKGGDARPWIATENATVIKICENTYDKPYVQLVFQQSESDRSKFRKVETILEQLMEDQLTGKIVENMSITSKSVREMFSWGSSFEGMKANVSLDWCDVYDESRCKIETDDVSKIVTEENREFRFVLEPTFCWLMNGRIGVHWRITQIKLCERRTKPSAFSLVDMLMDEDEDDAPAPTTPRAAIRETKEKTFSLVDMLMAED